MATHQHHQPSPSRVKSFMQQAHARQLTNLIHRLEAATSRLEDIASSAHDGPQDARSAAPSIKAPSVIGGAASSAPPAKIEIPEQTIELPETVQAFDTMMNDDLKPFADLCEKVGGLVAEQVSRN